MKFMQAKAVLFLMLLFLSLSVLAATTKVVVPLKLVSGFLMDPSSESMHYLYYLNDPKYGGVYRVIYMDTYNEAKNKKTTTCIISESSPKCKGFATADEALKDAEKFLEANQKDFDCKIHDSLMLINCREPKGKDSTGGDGSTGGGTGSPVDNGNGNSDNDEKPKPNPNQCGRTIAGVWVPMPCTAPPASDDGSGGGGGDGSGSGGGSGSSGGGSGGGGSDSDGGGGSGDGSGGMDYIPPEQPPEQPPKQPECFPNNPSQNMCGGGDVVSHGNFIHSCRRDKGNYQYEYYNFWVSKGEMLFCGGTAYSTSTDSSGNVTINIYNNYNTADEAKEAGKNDNDKDGDGLDDIYKIFDRDKDKNGNGSGGSGTGSNTAASSPSSPSGSGSSGSGSSGSNGSAASGVAGGQCEDGEDTLGCTPVGSESDVNKAIDGAIDGIGDSDFGIGEKEINMNTFKKGSDFVESGTCPPPKTVMILKARHEISYQQFCDVATTIRPIVILIAMFIAFTIVYMSILSKD